jgi:hypothetical protein
MRSLLNLAALAIPLFLFASAQACDCKPHPPPKKALEQAAAVFSGKVLKIADHDEHHWAVTFQLAATWKGTDAKEVTVLTGKNDGICGYKFAKGKSYMVYANESVRDEVKYLATGICHRTKLLEMAEEDLKELGKGKAVE